MVDFKTFRQSYPNFNDCSIQWFDDDKNRGDKSLAGHTPVNGIDRSKIRTINDSGCGVFFSVNSMSGGKRDKESVAHINSWVAESDTLIKEEQMLLIDNAPIKPSMVIESKNSYHIYYFAINGTKENRLQIERGLSTYYKGDKSFGKNYAMVLRLPGALHQKDPLDAFKTQCLYINDLQYTEEEIMTAFPYDMLLEQKTESFVSQPMLLKESSDIWEFMSSLGNEYMLSRLSGSTLTKSEKIEFKKNNEHSKQICRNGKASSCWIDDKDYVGSLFDGGPTWIQWCLQYGNTKSDVLKRFFEFCSDLIPDRFDRTSKQVSLDKTIDEDRKQKIQKDTNSSFRHITSEEKMQKGFDELWSTDPQRVMKFGWKEWDSYLGGIYGGMLYLIGSESGTGKSTFINQIAANLSRTGVRVTRYSLEDRMEESAKQELYYTINRMRNKEKRNKLDWVPFVNGEYTHENGSMRDEEILVDITNAMHIIEKSEIIDLDKTKDVGVDELIALMTQECDKGTRVFMIDHLHYFRYETDKQREDLQIESAMKAINELARQRNVAVFLVAHYNSAGVSKDGKPGMSSFKGSSSIKQIANIIIQIRRDGDELDEMTIFDVTKLRGPLPKKEIMSRFNLSTFEYEFELTTLQIESEKKHLFSPKIKVK